MLSATDDWQAVEVARSHPSENKIDTWEDPRWRDAHQVVVVGNDSAQSTQDDMIKEVVSTDRRADGFRDPGDSKVAEEQDGQGMDEKELQDATELEHKDGSGASEDNIAGAHTTANLTSSLEKESAADTLSDHDSINADLATSASGTGHSQLPQMLQSALSRTN